MMFLNLGPFQPGVCHLCGNPSGDDGSLCSTCSLEEEMERGNVALEEGPFLPEDDEEDVFGGPGDGFPEDDQYSRAP